MKILFVSLGCDKNSVDSEVMLGILYREGHTFTDDEEEAEAAVVNTCCFIGDAKEESIETIISLGKRRLSGQYKALIVTGCLAQRYFDEIHEELPEVDAVVTNAALEHIGEALRLVLKNTPRDFHARLDLPLHAGSGRIVLNGGYYEYLKIADGCDKRCTYCVIPSIRGPYRSIPMEELLAEAKELADRGVKELCLVAQETTLYGTDLYGEKRLPSLLRELCRIPGIEWIRLLYCYPEEITEELMDVIASEPKVLHYLDIPIQSGSDRILRQMGRKATREKIMTLVSELRKRIPDICLRTTLITGFPGETYKDHKETMELVDALHFDRLGVFPYSEEEGTVAAALPRKVSRRTAERRRDEIMSLQHKIVLEEAEDTVGSELRVMVEGRLPDEGVYAGRCYKDAPDVDGYVFFRSGREYLSGDFLTVRITGYDEYDLIGEPV